MAISPFQTPHLLHPRCLRTHRRALRVYLASFRTPDTSFALVVYAPTVALLTTISSKLLLVSGAASPPFLPSFVCFFDSRPTDRPTINRANEPSLHHSSFRVVHFLSLTVVSPAQVVSCLVIAPGFIPSHVLGPFGTVHFILSFRTQTHICRPTVCVIQCCTLYRCHRLTAMVVQRQGRVHDCGGRQERKTQMRLPF